MSKTLGPFYAQETVSRTIDTALPTRQLAKIAPRDTLEMDVLSACLSNQFQTTFTGAGDTLTWA